MLTESNFVCLVKSAITVAKMSGFILNAGKTVLLPGIATLLLASPVNNEVSATEAPTDASKDIDCCSCFNLQMIMMRAPKRKTCTSISIINEVFFFAKSLGWSTF